MNSLPSWFKKPIVSHPTYFKTVTLLEKLKINTVCKEAKCPNVSECYSNGTATFMILGKTCTRNCRFCAIHLGKPSPIDDKEPEKLSHAIQYLKLKHVVITMVTRDDLKDGGSHHFAKVIRKIRRETSTTIEVLTSDFRGNMESVDRVIFEKPDIFNHNIETIDRLQKKIRPMMNYQRSLAVLARAKKNNPQIKIKSGLMLGLGETESEIKKALQDLKAIDCDFLTLGQYLKPPESKLNVERFLNPKEFKELKQYALSLGFSFVESGPLVRSSYHAEKVLPLISPKVRSY